MTSLPVFPRDMLNSAFNGNVRMINAFEELIRLLVLAVTDVETAASSVVTLAGTEFVLAAASEAVAQGRVLVEGGGISIAVGPDTITISYPISVTGGTGTFILTGDTNLILPTIGTVATTQDIFNYIASAQDFADDVAAAAGGVSVGGIYRTASVLKVRVT